MELLDLPDELLVVIASLTGDLPSCKCFLTGTGYGRLVRLFYQHQAVFDQVFPYNFYVRTWRKFAERNDTYYPTEWERFYWHSTGWLLISSFDRVRPRYEWDSHHLLIFHQRKPTWFLYPEYDDLIIRAVSTGHGLLLGLTGGRFPTRRFPYFIACTDFTEEELASLRQDLMLFLAELTTPDQRKTCKLELAEVIKTLA